MVLKKIALIWILAASLLLAQKVTQIKFEGLSYLSPSVAKEIIGIHPGENVDAQKINQAIKNLFSQGYFKDVWVDQKGSKLIFHFKEKKAIANVDVKGYGSGDDGEELLKTIGLKKGDLYDERRIQKAKKALISNLEQKGYYDTVVEVIIVPVGENSVAVTFDVNKGEKIKIVKMNFVGAKKLSQGDLEMNLANKEADFLGWLPLLNDGTANVDQLEYDTYRVKDVYMKHGYLDAYVSKPLMRVDFGSYKAEIDYQVKEGDQYRVGEVAVSQNIEGLNSKKLLSSLRLKKGKIFNIERMRKDIKKLQEATGNEGYAYAKVIPQMHKNPEEHTIDIRYVVRPGVPVVINDVLISGNTSTKDRVIRRYLYLAPGDTFNATDLKDSKNALGRTGFFEKVDIQPQRISEDKINLLVNVKEAPTGTISVGGGYGSYEGAMFNASVSDKNFLGTGISASAGFEISKISKSYNLSFTNPKVWDSQYSLSLSLYKRKYEYYNFTQDTAGGSLMIGREFWRYFHASAGVGYVDNKSRKNNNKINNSYYNDYNLTIDPRGFYNDKYKKASIYASLSFDNTDDFYTPREGMIAALNFEYASLDGDDYNATIGSGEENGYGKFFKTNAKFGVYYGLEDWIDYDLILRFKARATVIDSGSNEKLPIGEKLFLGGIGSVRGFQPYSLSPGSSSTGYGLGGKKRASTSIEASIPLSTAAKMRLAGFYDYGMIGEESFDEIKRSSVGVVIEWQSGFGPINLVFAKALDDKPGDRTSTFEFSMGSKF